MMRAQHDAEGLAASRVTRIRPKVRTDGTITGERSALYVQVRPSSDDDEPRCGPLVRGHPLPVFVAS